jgi:hypothetical protein
MHYVKPWRSSGSCITGPGANSGVVDQPNRIPGGYADYMETDRFEKGATQLVNLAARSPTAMLCAERAPERCHRRLIADYLTLRGVEVIHLIERTEARVHSLSSEARRESAQLIYDRHVGTELDP